ncbi:MAG: CBS domain-containing protein [bacterium]
MSGGVIGILISAGGVLFLISILVRVKTGGKYEIKIIDLTLVLIPLFIWLIITGKIQKFAVGGVEFETAQAFIGATEAPIESQVAMTLPFGIEQVVETVERDAKAGVSQIPRLIRKKTEALEFRLGHGGYWGPAIQKYFESLDANAFLRYAIIYYQDGSLFGVFDAKELLRYFRENGEASYQSFARYLNNPNDESLRMLKELPGFIPGEYAVTPNANKRSVLEDMERLKMGTLPVVDSNGRFVGMVDRTQLTASLIIDVAKKLEGIK